MKFGVLVSSLKSLGLFLVACVSLSCSDSKGELEQDAGILSDAKPSLPDGMPPLPDGKLPPFPKDGQVPSVAKLNVFYVIHAHLSDDRLPYDSKLMKDGDLNGTKADNMVALIRAIKAVADKHGLKIAWQPTIGPAKGFCQHQGSDHIFKELLGEGHEIGVHAHKSADLEPTYDYLTNDCGLDAKQITSGSGYQAFLGNTTGAERTALFSESVKQYTGWGVTVGTSNLIPDSDGSHEMAPVCTTQWGKNSDSWKTTGNFLYPWKPDISNAVPCDHDPNGTFVMVDHSGPDWTLASGKKANVLTDLEFGELQVYFDAAVSAAANTGNTGTNGNVAAWGFVTHITEYTAHNTGEGSPNQGALDALDTFLSYIDTKRDQGLVTYSTPSNIAQSAYP
jgi:hypothetical protein